ncbi:MAG: phosphoglycerate kinase [Patescibacteria group bacterium]
MKKMSSLRVSGKRVLLRVDFNVPIENGVIKDRYRISASVPTIKKLLKRGASLIIIAHLGRPEGYDTSLTLRPIVRVLSGMLKKKIQFVKTIEEAEKEAHMLGKGRILMLENIRFFKGEVENSLEFSQRLAALGDVYVNDAFGNAHREHASTVGVPKYLPHAAGLLLEKEVEYLGRVFKKSKRPIVAIIGGAKIQSKLPLIEQFLKKADAILVGGGIANTILAAKHISIGLSVADVNVDISWLDLSSRKFHLPVDAAVTESLAVGSRYAVRAVGEVLKGEYIADIGPDSVLLFKAIVAEAKTIIWNGPLGYIEVPAFSKGTIELVKAVAGSKAFKIIGGGDLNRVVDSLKLQKKLDHMSTGGGAMLEFLAGKKLPGIEALK